jgi:hypothetical protein
MLLSNVVELSFLNMFGTAGTPSMLPSLADLAAPGTAGVHANLMPLEMACLWQEL